MLMSSALVYVKELIAFYGIEKNKYKVKQKLFFYILTILFCKFQSSNFSTWISKNQNIRIKRRLAGLT